MLDLKNIPIQYHGLEIFRDQVMQRIKFLKELLVDAKRTDKLFMLRWNQ